MAHLQGSEGRPPTCPAAVDSGALLRLTASPSRQTPARRAAARSWGVRSSLTLEFHTHEGHREHLREGRAAGPPHTGHPRRDPTPCCSPLPSRHPTRMQSGAAGDHSFLFPQVQDAVKCRVVDRQEEGNGDSGGSFQNGHAQLMVGLRAWCPQRCRLTLLRAALGSSSPWKELRAQSEAGHTEAHQGDIPGPGSEGGQDQMVRVWLGLASAQPHPRYHSALAQMPASGGCRLSCCPPAPCTSRAPLVALQPGQDGTGLPRSPSGRPALACPRTLPPAVALSQPRPLGPPASHLACSLRPGTALPPCCPPHRCPLRCHLQGALPGRPPPLLPPGLLFRSWGHPG